MTSTPPSVLAIGSCRIFRPLRRLHGDGVINLVNIDDHRWFTHTAAGARQYVDLMQGRLSLPEDLRGAVLETELPLLEDLSAEFPPIDLTVVEVSTLKELHVGGVHLNAHKVYGIAKDLGIDYRPVIQGTTDLLPDEHPLKNMRVNYASEDGVAADLLHIREHVGSPVLAVDHLYSETADGEPIPERQKLTDALSSIGARHGMEFYSTKDLIVEHGIAAALTDQNHYRKEFEPVVAGRMLPRIESAAVRS